MSEAGPTPAIETMLRDEASRHRAWLRRLAASLVVDAARADDLVQQTLLAALERPPPDASRPRPWLAAVLRNLARRFGKSEKRRAEHERAAAVGERLPPTDEVVAEAALQHEISAALLALEEPYRSTLLLRFFKNLPPRAIGKRMGLPTETVRTRVNRGIELLRARLIAGRGAAMRERMLGLVALLDGGTRRAVRHALLAMSVGGGGAAIGLGWMGVLAMSTKLKLAAAALVVVTGSVAVWKLTGRSGLPAPAHSRSGELGTGRSAPASVVDMTPPPPATVDATRAVETASPPAETTAPVPVPALLALAGVVRTAAGQPAAGAVVVLEQVEHDAVLGGLNDLVRNATDMLDLPPGSQGRFRRTVAATDGSFRFEPLAAGAHLNVAAIDRAEGLGLAAGLKLDAARAAEPVEIVLQGGVVLHGRVADADGRPIAGAFVTVSAFTDTEGGRPQEGPSAFVHGQTDTEGEYGMLPLPFLHFHVSVSARGYRDAWTVVRIAAGKRDHREDLTLARAEALAGRILRADGSPADLAGARREFLVVASAEDPRECFLSPVFGLGSKGAVRLDEDRYEFESAGFGWKFVSLWCDHELLGSAAIEQGAEGPDLVVDLSALPPPPVLASLRLDVIDAENGNPVPRFKVVAVRDIREEEDPELASHRAESHDATGRVELPGLALGRYDVEIRAVGYAPAFVAGLVTDDPNAAPTHVELCRTVAALRGRVVDERGGPIVGADVSLLGPDGRAAMPFPDYRATTNASGEFAFAAIPEGDWFICAEKRELAPAAVAVTAGDEAAMVTLSAGVVVKLQGRCGDANYRGRNTVEIRDEQGVPVVDQARAGAWILTGGVDQMPIRLAPGRYTVVVFAPGFRCEPVHFTAAPGATVDLELVPIADRRRGR